MSKAEATRAFHERNPGYAREWRERNRESCLASGAKWRAANKDKIAARQKERYDKNLEAHRVARANRRALSLGLSGTLTLAQWNARLDRYDRKCAYCFSPFETLDHVVPLVAGGGSTVENCVPCCRECNNRKSFVAAGKRPLKNQRGGEPWVPHIASDFWPSLPEVTYGPVYNSDKTMKKAA